MKEEIKSSIFDVISREWGENKIKLDEIEINYPPDGLGDYSCNIGMKLAGKLKQSPVEISEKIVGILNKAKKEEFKKIEVVKPGFINFHLSEKHLQQLVAEINSLAGRYGNCDLGKSEKILIDFVSANPTGPIHLGNGRGGPFGDSLGNVLEKCGFEIYREYYVNDYGNQIKILGHSVLKDEEAQYKGEYIDELNKELEEKDSSFAEASKDKPFEAGQWAAHKIIKEIIQPSMEKLGINFDSYFSEKSLHDEEKVEEIFELLEKGRFTYEKDKALWFKASEFGDEKDRVIRKTDGTVTYFGADIANHKDRFDRGVDNIINIWGADHHGDVKRVLGSMEALGYKDRVEIILTQMVRVIKDGKEYKMSKRAGTYISIDDLLEEAGKDAVRFLFLLYSNNTHINFDIDLAKEKSDKNPVYYVQYAHARICSILRKAKKDGWKEEGVKKLKVDLLKNKKELTLLKHLNKFPELVVDMAAAREIHHLPNYLIKLADKFHSFYNECKVLDDENEELTQARIKLIKSAKVVLEEGLRLLGVSAPEKM